MEPNGPCVELFEGKATLHNERGESVTVTGEPAAVASYARTSAYILEIPLVDRREKKNSLG